MGFVTGKPFVDIIIGTNIFLECNHKEFLSWKILSVCVCHTIYIEFHRNFAKDTLQKLHRNFLILTIIFLSIMWHCSNDTLQSYIETSSFFNKKINK
jgi:EamA domain-containing membrane protein RarD